MLETTFNNRDLGLYCLLKNYQSERLNIKKIGSANITANFNFISNILMLVKPFFLPLTSLHI